MLQNDVSVVTFLVGTLRFVKDDADNIFSETKYTQSIYSPLHSLINT